MPVATMRTKTAPRTQAASGFALSPGELARYFQAKLAAEWGPHDLKRTLEERKDGLFLLDVRSRQGFQGGHIPGAKNIPLEELQARLKELPKEKEIVTYCWNVTCSLCTKAAFLLARQGFRVRELVGGIAEWQAAGFPTEK